MSSFNRVKQHSFHRELAKTNVEETPEVVPDDGWKVGLLKFSVIGLMFSAEFQKCKYIVESLYRCYPEKFLEPSVKPMLDMDWNDFLLKGRRCRGGPLWTLQTGVAVYINDNFMGDERALSKYVSSRYILPLKNYHQMGREALKSHLMEIMAHGRRCIYLMVAIDDVIIGSMIFTLFEDMVPKTCRVFLKRCRKLKGGYSNTPIHRIVKSSWIQCGGYQLKEVKMPCENFSVSHGSRGILSMCNNGRHKKNTTQFLITLQRSNWMDTHYVAFGQLLYGDSVLSQIEAVPTKYQAPQKNIEIVRAGKFNVCRPKLCEGSLEKELNSFLDGRMSKNFYRNYCAKTEVALEKMERKQGEVMQKASDFPIQMVPTNVQEAFNYVPGKKSSCKFEVEKCSKCGCNHDVKGCRLDVHHCPSKDSLQ